MIKAIGTAARRELERELGTRVHLDLSVRVRRSWRGDDALLDRLGHHVAKIVPVELLERDARAGGPRRRRSRSRASGRARGASSRARPGSARPRSSPTAAGDADGVLWGACDPLITPRPLGPLRDVAPPGRRRAAEAAIEAARARRVLAAVLDELARRRRARGRGPALGRRRDARPRGAARAGGWPRSRGCLILTCRADAARPRSGACSARCRASACGGSSRAALSAEAVALLARRAGPRPAPTCTPSRAATRSSSPRCWPRPPAAACRRACATRSRCASALIGAGGARGRRAGRRRPGAGRAVRSWRDAAPAPRRSTSASTPGC